MFIQQHDVITPIIRQHRRSRARFGKEAFTMNDPGLDGPIDNTARNVTRTIRTRVPSDSRPPDAEHAHGAREAFRHEICVDEEEEDIGYFGSKRWWFTSTAFPLIAGTFGPLANLFSVCALVQTWRIHISEDGTTQRIKDPPWLTALNSISLVFALCANILLLFNFAHRVRYSIAQPFTIALWYLASLLLLIPLALSHRLLRIEPLHQHPFSESYFYGIIAAALYFIISTLLALNHFGATIAKAYPPSFNTLTIPQRTLMLQTIAYTMYLAAGAGIFAGLEGWEFVDGVYWADYTLLTIGLGTDFPLQTAAAKAILIPYAVGGITAIGLVIGSIRALVVERGKTKVARRTLGEEREHRMEVMKADGMLLEMAKKRERDWLQREFEMMREIEAHAGRKRKAWALATSVGAFLVLWLGGAMVFTFAEEGQSWTYPTAAYFAYTSLLTIGYGDFYPQSNAGKPFFVLWSLLAVPTVTVLISSMGDTVVQWVHTSTLWLAKRTILPETSDEKSDVRGHRITGDGQKKGGSKPQPDVDDEKAARRGAKWRAQQDEEDRGTGNRYHNMQEDSSSIDHPTPSHTNQSTEQHPSRKTPRNPTHPSYPNDPDNRKGFRGEEKSAAFDRTTRKPTRSSQEARVLAHAILHVGRDVGQKPPRRYNWQEWEELMDLIGGSEHDASKSSEGRISSGASARDIDNDRGKEENDASRSVWTFLADDGPLLSRGGEAEWALEKLCKRLEDVLDEPTATH
ncbi:hypothetical protein HGRIS_005516 [Hohenbuehelia grisea]|uniref:Potassium channel domain-containing protein n=1 Tax=Hohenbuehelia grisea TaxID=104357 RepID=A0ABR3JXZ3_9AGAR